MTTGSRATRGGRRRTAQEHFAPIAAQLPLHCGRGGLRPERLGTAARCYEASVSPHADFTGTASGGFQLSGPRDSAGVCLPGRSTPSAPGKGRPQRCGGFAKAPSSGIPQPGGPAPAGPARRAEPGLPGGLFLALRQRPPLTY